MTVADLITPGSTDQAEFNILGEGKEFPAADTLQKLTGQTKTGAVDGTGLT